MHAFDCRIKSLSSYGVPDFRFASTYGFRTRRFLTREMPLSMACLLVRDVLAPLFRHLLGDKMQHASLRQVLRTCNAMLQGDVRASARPTTLTLQKTLRSLFLKASRYCSSLKGRRLIPSAWPSHHATRLVALAPTRAVGPSFPLSPISG